VGPFPIPRSELPVVREATQLELSGLVNDVTPAGTTVLLWRLLRMVFGNPSRGSIQIHPAVDGQFLESFPQCSDNARHGPMDLAVGAYSIDDHVPELRRLHQVRSGFPCFVHVASERDQLFKVSVDLCVRLVQCVLRLKTAI